MDFETVSNEIKTAIEEIRTRQNDGASKAEVEAMNATIKTLQDELAAVQTKMLRPQVSDTEKKEGLASDDYKAAFEHYLRTKDDSRIREFKTISQYSTTDGEGGYMVPEVIQSTIITNLTAMNPIRQYANVVQVASGVTSFPFAGDSISAGMIAEAGTHTATTAAAITTTSIETKDFYVNFPVSNKQLSSVSNLSAWVADQCSRKLAEYEGTQFINGTGATIYVQGICATGNGVTPVATAAASGVIAESDLIDLFYSLKQGYRQNAVWLMSGAIAAKVRKLKDATGAYLWDRSLAPGQPSTLLGRPVVECDSMATTLAANGYLVAIADLGAGYAIVDQPSFGLQVNPYAAMGFTSFQISKYTGAAVVQPEAIKILKASAGA